jgi:hypothetical protein
MPFYIKHHALRYYISIMGEGCDGMVMRWDSAESMEIVPWTEQVQNWSVCMPLHLLLLILRSGESGEWSHSEMLISWQSMACCICDNSIFRIFKFVISTYV